MGEGMEIRTLQARYKRTSALRRVRSPGSTRWQALPGPEGCVAAFEFPLEAPPIVVEAPSGRAMTLAPGDIFLATPGHRESTRWVVGRVPEQGLLPGSEYWVLAESGVVGELIGDSSLEKGHLGRVRYLGAVLGEGGQALFLRDFATRSDANAPDAGAPVFLILGTSAEVGKTTAGLAVLGALRLRGYRAVTVLKATGTSSVSELAAYSDFGAVRTFDCVDFGIPTTYPSGRDDIGRIFARAVGVCLSLPADAVLIECGGDILGANVPKFLEILRSRRPAVTVVLVAGDTLGALGAKDVLAGMGVSVDLITGPCTDTPTLQTRTEALCGIPTRNMRSKPALVGIELAK